LTGTTTLFARAVIRRQTDAMAAPRATDAWERYSWAAGIVFVVALVAEVAVAAGIPVNQDDSATTIARELDAHRGALIAVACLSIVYADAFLIYLWRLHAMLGRNTDRAAGLATLVLVGGVLFVTAHAVSDIGITGMLGAKLAAFSVRHDAGLSYTLYLTTYALDSVGDVLGSLFAGAAGVLVLRTGRLPRWLGWTALAVGVLFVVQGFGLGGVIAFFGLVVDLIAFVLLLVFVLVTSAVLLRRAGPRPPAELVR
jgi:hypothetical protein